MLDYAEAEKLLREKNIIALKKLAVSLINKSLKSKVKCEVSFHKDKRDCQVNVTFFDKHSRNFSIMIYTFDNEKEVEKKKKEICDVMKSEKLFNKKLN